jgi:hypothetical protein
MDLLNQLKRDLDPKQGLALAVTKDLSFQQKPTPTLADTYRRQLNTIATSVVQTMSSMLGMLSVDQLEALAKDSEAKVFLHPQDDGNGVTVEGIYKEGKTWWFVFAHSDDGLEAGSYRLEDLNVSDVLWLMDRLEAQISKK